MFGELLTEGYTDSAEDAVKPSWWTSPLTNYPKKAFDSKIVSTDFDGSGRIYKKEGVENAKFNIENNNWNDLQGCAPSIIFASFGAESVGGILEATNQILFWGCRFESFTDGALAIIGEGPNVPV